MMWIVVVLLILSRVRCVVADCSKWELTAIAVALGVAAAAAAAAADNIAPGTGAVAPVLASATLMKH